MFSGLYRYEIALLTVGVALFVALTVSLLRSAFKDKPFASLIPAFFIPFAMIGQPSVKSVQYKDDLRQIQKATAHIAAYPDNELAVDRLKSLETKLNLIAPRAQRDPVGNNVVQTARLILDRPAPQEALLIASVEKYAVALRANPDDEVARRILIINMTRLKSLSTGNAATTAIDHAQQAMSSRQMGQE